MEDGKALEGGEMASVMAAGRRAPDSFIGRQ